MVLGGVYTTPFSWQKRMFAHRLGLPFTRKRWKRILKTESFESGHQSGDLENGVKRKRRVNSKNGDLSEYDGHCHATLTWLSSVQKWIRTVSLFLLALWRIFWLCTKCTSFYSSVLTQAGTRENQANVGAISGFYQPASHEATSSSSRKTTTLLDKTRENL